MSATMDKLAKELKKQMSASDDRKPKAYDTQAEVLRVEDGTAWVHIPGGVTETPVRMTINAKKGDMVNVHIADGTAWITGNGTNPPTDDSTANYAIDISNTVKKDVTILNTIVTDEIEATHARFGDVEADTAKIHDLTADQLIATVGYIDDLTAANISASDISADHATVGELDATYATIENLNATNANVQSLQTNKADISDLNAATARIGTLEADHVSTTDLAASNARIGSLEADHVTTAQLNAVNGEITNLKSSKADISVLEANYATLDELHSDYAEIDLANVNNAWIENGVIKDAAISDAQIIGVSANKLTAGTIDASNITVTNLNADNITTGTINGQRIGSESITLDKLAEEVPTKEYLDNVANNLQGQIDGQIETWTGTVVPTLNNTPASAWTTADDRHKHVGDIYYVVNAGNTADGYTYRFTESGTTTKTYSWTLIKDNQITKALQDILDMQGDISDIQTFDSQISSWKTDTDDELSSLKTRTSTLETNMGKKVDTTTFNEVSQKVDENSANITSLSSVVDTKADGSTVTTLSNTVNTVSQKADSNSSKITSLTQTLGTNADGTTKADDIVHRTSAVEQDLSGFKTTVSETYQTKSDMSDYSTTTQMNSAIEQKAGEISLSVAQTEISKIEIGGKNLAQNSAKLDKEAYGNNKYIGKRGKARIITISEEFNEVQCTSTYQGALIRSDLLEFKEGDVITFSFLSKYVGEIDTPYISFFPMMYHREPYSRDTSILMPISLNGGSYINANSRSWRSVLPLTEEYQKYTATFIWPAELATDDIYVELSIQASAKAWNGGYISLYQPKLEKGNKATDWTPAPEDVEAYTDTQVSAAKAEIKVTTDGISTEVSKKVGSSEIISKINQSAETVQIDASKVEINGTATFNAIKASADAAYDAKGSASAVQTNLDNLEVGGKNYCAEVAVFVNGSVSGITYTYKGDGVWNISGTATAANARGTYAIIDHFPALGYGDTFTLSLDNTYDSMPSGMYFYVNFADSSSTTSQKVIRGDYRASSFTFTCESNYRIRYIGLGFLKDVAVNVDLRMKLERGNKATDWTPAPEDVQSEIDAKKSVHTLDTTYSYTYSQILTYSAEGDTSHGAWAVTSASGVKVGDTVRLKVTVSDMSNAPVYVIGTVTAVSGNNVTMTSHGLDTTVIDGGNILTNSIGANQIAANAITSDELAANSVIAGKIATGAVTADKIAANAITANKLRMADYNNYVTVTENDESSLLPNGGITIVDGWCYKTSATDSNVGVSAIKANWTKTGEKYRVTGIAKAPAAGAVRIYLGGRNADGSWVMGNYCETALAADTETAISGIVTVSSALEACAKCNISVRFYSDSSGSSGPTYQVGYFKQLRVERMSGAELIVDGSITADKIAANAITIGKIASDTQSQILNSAVNVDARNYWVAIDSSKRTIGKGSVNYTYDEEGTYVLICTTASTGYAQIYTSQWIDATDLAGKTVIFHADSITTTNSSADERVYVAMQNASGVGLGSNFLNASNLSRVITLPASLAKIQLIIRMDQNKAHAVGDVMTVVKPKLEIGHQATGWTQAPEDIELDIADSAKTATTYITAIDNNGIKVHAQNNPTKNYTQIDADGMEVYSNSDSVASFGADGVRVGKIQDPHIEFGSTSSNFYGNNQALVGKITSGEEGISTYTNAAFVGSSTITGRGVIDSVPKTLYDAELWYKPETDISVSYNIDGTNYTKTISKSTDSDQTVNGMRFKYTVATNKLLIQCVKNPFTLSYEVNSDTRYPNASDSRCATYDYNSSNKRGVLTLNYTPVTGTAIKVTEGIVGTFSFTAGTSQTLTRTSSGTTVTAVYNATNKTVTLTATGTLTTPTFDSVTYTIKCANVGGVDLTFDRKYWKPQFSFGLDNTMNEYGFANAFGQGLIIGAEHQTVLGKYNTQLTDALFIIGKGSNSSTRSNAAFVTTAGNMTIAGRLTQSSDRRLKEHISYLDSDADDFIRDLKPAHYTKDNAKHVGFYAQDVEEADKWDCMVGEMNGYKTLGYTELIAPLVAYCQHLEKRIEALERTIK